MKFILSGLIQKKLEISFEISIMDHKSNQMIFEPSKFGLQDDNLFEIGIMGLCWF